MKMADVMHEDDENQEEIVIVEDESQLQQGDEDDDQDDERVARSEDDSDGNDDEREAIRERRRLEKQERKERRDQAIKRDKLELDFLRKRNDDLERRLTAQEQRAHRGDLNAIDGEIARAAKEADMAERVIAKAVAAGNGDDVAQAMRYRDQAMQRAQQLQYQKQLASQQAPSTQPGIDDLTMSYAQEFIKENPWYDAQGRDEDSAIVIAIDQALAKDGYNPQTEEYWSELRRRASRRLPERFEQRQQRRQSNEPEGRREPRGGPAVGSGREHAPQSTRREVYVSPERKQALIEAGVWDDPVLRAKYVKRYAEYDRNNRS
jgi:hypothetical protein